MRLRSWPLTLTVVVGVAACSSPTQTPSSTLADASVQPAPRCELPGACDAGAAEMDGGHELVEELCPDGALEGDFYFERASDVDRLVNCTRITGGLFVNSFGGEPFGAALVMPNLESVGGDLSISADALTSVSMPALERVGGSLHVDSPVIADDSFPALVTVQNLLVYRSPVYLRLPALRIVKAYVDIHYESLVEVLDLGALESVAYIAAEGVSRLAVLSMPQVADAENVRIRSNPKLRKIDLAALRATRVSTSFAIDIASNPSLNALTLVSLTKVAGLSVRENPLLTGLSMPVLTAVEGGFVVATSPGLAELSVPRLNLVTDEVTIRETALSVLSAPLTSADSLSVELNPSLTSLSLPMLISIQGTVSVTANELLPTSQAQAIVDQLQNFKGMAWIDGNAP